MLWLLKVLIFGKWCDHKWEDMENGNLWLPGSKMPVGSWANCRCKNCGKWERFTLT